MDIDFGPMELKSFYVSDDGKQFEKAEDCKKYEDLIERIAYLSDKIGLGNIKEEDYFGRYDLREYAQSTSMNPLELFDEVEAIQRLAYYMTCDVDQWQEIMAQT